MLVVALRGRDMVMEAAVMTLKTVTQGQPLVVAPEWSQPILERMPEVDEVFPLAGAW